MARMECDGFKFERLMILLIRALLTHILETRHDLLVATVILLDSSLFNGAAVRSHGII